MSTPTPSTRDQLLAAVVARLRAIRRRAGFATDVGEAVFRGVLPILGPDDPDTAVAVVVGEDTPRFQGEQLLIRLPLHLAVVAKADLDEPWESVELVLTDVKRAMELADRTVGGLVRGGLERGQTRTLDREPGTTTTGVVVTYIAPYLERWGQP